MTVAEFITMVESVMPSNADENDFISWINIMEDTIYQKFVIDADKPDLKTLATISSDELSLMTYGYRWLAMYQYWVYGNISLMNEEYTKANNNFSYYNGMMDEFVQQHFPEVDNTVRSDRLNNYR